MTGADLSVFNQDPNTHAYSVLTNRKPIELWDAFSPNLAITPKGKIFLSMVAGAKNTPTGNDYHAYLVGFDFNASSPSSMAKGWFVPPAKRVGPTRIVDPQSGSTLPAPTQTSLAADSQLSVYMSYVEAVGTVGTQPNRCLMVSRP